MASFSLELHPDKTRLIEFGRFAQKNRRAEASGVETFDFLGFTHYCRTTRNGKFGLGASRWASGDRTLARRHDLSRTLIRIWVRTACLEVRGRRLRRGRRGGRHDPGVRGPDRSDAALERLVGKEKRLRWQWRRPQSRSWRVDETYIKVRGKWAYLYRAVDKLGNTIDFYLSATRNTKAAKRFLGKALRG